MLATSSGLRLLCDFSFTTQGDLGSIYTCAGRVVFAGDTRYVTELDGNHVEGQNDTNVEALLYNQDIGFTPRNISRFLPNLKLLHANAINSPELGREHLEGLQSLRTLRFGNNKLREIEYDLFIDNPLLTAIYLEYNPIRHVAHNAFDHPSGLLTLYLFEAACTTGFASNNRGDVELLLFKILLECPPTFRMIEERIINGSELNNKIQSQINSDFDILHTRLKAIEEQQSTLEQRVEVLEQN